MSLKRHLVRSLCGIIIIAKTEKDSTLSQTYERNFLPMSMTYQKWGKLTILGERYQANSVLLFFIPPTTAPCTSYTD